MKRVQMIMENLGKMEDEIFKTRQRKELEFRARDKRNRSRAQIERNAANMYRVRAIFTDTVTVVPNH